MCILWRADLIFLQEGGKTEDGEPVHSFRTLLPDLATLTRNTVRFGDTLPMTVLSRPAPIQRRAFDLLGIALAP